MDKKSLKSVLRITGLYTLFGGFWIALSDRILELVLSDPHRMTVIQTYKGWGFVLASALLLAYLSLKEFRAREEMEQTRERDRKRTRMYIDMAEVILAVLGSDERVKIINRKGAEILNATEAEILGQNWFESYVPDRIRSNARASFRMMLDGNGSPGLHDEGPVLSRGGSERIISWRYSPLRDESGRIMEMLISGEDITIRRAAEKQAEFRLSRLTALHAIDLMITSAQDLRTILRSFLDLIVSQFRVDAADILLVNRQTPLLEYAAETGFRNPGISRSRLRIGEGLAGKAALERRIITVPDLRTNSEGFLRSALIDGEDIVAYYAVPLVSKGVVKGILELMHRAPLVLDKEHLDFLEAMASQAAIAIDNALLYEDLQRSNIELLLAYDATLEGWARALDLRDRMTERHTERVTEMTVSIARAMGVREEEIVHIRRGALLHDIGKIGIPDSILRKEGPLTREEREIMQHHPAYAFDMLKPVAFLRPAIDIPYCHHERWDGTGYPRGLKGEQIPLAARIFSLADIWDAVFSDDRPYRRALSRGEACEHIRSLAGSHLDPKVVDTFLALQDHPCPIMKIAGISTESAV